MYAWHFYPNHREKDDVGNWKLKLDASIYHDTDGKQYTFPPPRYTIKKFIEDEYYSGDYVRPQERWANEKGMPDWMLNMLAIDADLAIDGSSNENYPSSDDNIPPVEESVDELKRERAQLKHEREQLNLEMNMWRTRALFMHQQNEEQTLLHDQQLSDMRQRHEYELSGLNETYNTQVSGMRQHYDETTEGKKAEILRQKEAIDRLKGRTRIWIGIHRKLDRHWKSIRRNCLGRSDMMICTRKAFYQGMSRHLLCLIRLSKMMHFLIY